MFCFNVAHCRAVLFLCTGRIFLLGEYFSFVFFLSSVMFLVNYIIFICFSCSGWGIGPCGGVVEPDLVAKMRSDEGSGGNFFLGPSVMVPYREHFANERYTFGDSQYHACGKYAALEKKFFSENEEIMREIFFDTNNLLGVDSDDDVDEVVPVNYHDLVPEMFSEEGQLRRDRVKEILETKIVRLSPVNLESEDEETMERVASPMVVETVSDLVDASVVTVLVLLTLVSLVRTARKLLRNLIVWRKLLRSGWSCLLLLDLLARMLALTTSCLGLGVVLSYS